MRNTRTLCNGAEAATHSAYNLSDLLVVQPVIENAENSALLGQISLEWKEKKITNAYGRIPEVMVLGHGECTGVSLLEKLQQNRETGGDSEELQQLVAAGVLSGSGSLVKMLPNIYKLVSQGFPTVLHVSASKSNASCSSLETDYSDIFALRDSGVGILSGGSPQEVYDLGLISHLTSLKTNVPFINFFDGTRVSSELQKINLISADNLQELITPGICDLDDGQVVQSVMDQSKELLGKHYRCFEFEGPEDAEFVLVAIGSTARSLIEAVRFQMADKKSVNKSKIGVLKIVLLRPWSNSMFLNALPASTRRVCVIDQNKSGNNDTPLFKDVAAAFHSDAQWATPVLITGNIVVSNKVGVIPSFCKAILDNLESSEPKHKFLLSDLPSACDLPIEKNFHHQFSSDLLKQAVSWTMGHNSLESSHALSVVLGPLLDLNVQQNIQTSEATQISRADIRFAPLEIMASYPVLNANVIACDDAGILLLPHVNVLSQAKKGTKLLINVPWKTKEEADNELPVKFRQNMKALGVDLYVIDANKLANGSATNSNWVLQAAIAKLLESPFSAYRPIFSHLGNLIKTNTGGMVNLDELADTKIASHIQLVEYSTTSTVLSKKHTSSNDQQDVETGSLFDMHSNLYNSVPFDMLPFGSIKRMSSSSGVANQQSGTEEAYSTAYSNLLSQLFGDRLFLADTTGNKSLPKSLEDANSVKKSLETCFGGFLVKTQARNRLVDYVGKIISSSTNSSSLSKELLSALGIWHGMHNNAVRCSKIVPRLIDLLANEKHKGQSVEYIFNNRTLLYKSSKWIIGGDNWAYDLSNSGIRHIISSGQDVNVLILDTERYDQNESNGQVDDEHQQQERNDIFNSSAMSIVSTANKSSQNPSKNNSHKKSARRKKNIGLYAMNYGTAYVASVSVLSSQSQAMRAVAEADNFKGPSIILAHIPGFNDEIGRQSAQFAVDNGSWPLYRWNPTFETDEFTLDSNKIKSEIEEFLKREQNLTMLANSAPNLSGDITEGSIEAKHNKAHQELSRAANQRRMNEQFDQLLDGMSGNSGNSNLELLVLYGSDSGHASGVAESIAKKAEVSGCGEVRCIEANDFVVDNLAEEKHVLLILATAGQGEACANAKNFTSTILDYSNKLDGLKYSVFGLGDSHYWGEGTADSEKYFCLNARQVDEKLNALGAERIVPVGLGDDQAADGYNSALGDWENEVWDTLNIKIKGGDLGGPPAIVDDDIKIKSNFLRGMIDEGLRDLSTGKLLPEDTKLTKFHGIYQQDLRSVREELDAKGVERAYSFMIRIGVPGGVATSEQYLAMDSMCNKYCNGVLKLTTRQAYQVHGVLKKNLKTTMKAINRACMDTLAACGDVNRNIIANPHHRKSEVHKQVLGLARDLQAHLRPKTSAYAEIWLDKKPVGGSVDHEPIYGATYLPRKFKIAIAVPPLNDVDVFSHCLGLVAIVDPKNKSKLLGYNVCVGGGMGTTHGNKATYPRLSDVMGFVEPENVIPVTEAIVKVQRDFGDRENRKHARLKYTVEDMGITKFRSKVEEYSGGIKIGKAYPMFFNTNADPFGWEQYGDGTWQYTLFVENGYVKDLGDYKIKTALKEIAEAHPGGEFSLTATQNIIIGNISPERKPVIEALFKKYRIDNNQWSAMRLHSMACVALPTCALAMAESQTYLPTLITKIEVLLDMNGLRHDAITIRMTGCPNGCGRPAMAEIGFIGKAIGQYNMYLGGGFAGNRVSKMYREGVNEEQILEILGPMLKSYATSRQDGEHFGDFCIRTGIIEPTLEGKLFWSYGKENKSDKPAQVYW